jgi:hypothetical protein
MAVMRRVREPAPAAPEPSTQPAEPVTAGYPGGWDWSRYVRLDPAPQLGATTAPEESEAERAAEAMLEDRPAAITPSGRDVVRRRPCAACAGGGCSACASADEDEIRRSTEATDDGGPVAPEVAAELRELGPGRALPAETRGRFEPLLGIPLDDVRVHDDARAARLATELDAEAFTLGDDIVLGAPLSGTDDDARLIAHELAHVAQQRRGELTVQRRGLCPSPAQGSTGPEDVVRAIRLALRGEGGVSQLVGEALSVVSLVLGAGRVGTLMQRPASSRRPAHALELLRAHAGEVRAILDGYCHTFGADLLDEFLEHASEDLYREAVRIALPVMTPRERVELALTERGSVRAAWMALEFALTRGAFADWAPFARMFSDEQVVTTIRAMPRDERETLGQNADFMGRLRALLEPDGRYQAERLLLPGDHFDAAVAYLRDAFTWYAEDNETRVYDTLLSLPRDERYRAFDALRWRMAISLSEDEHRTVVEIVYGSEAAGLAARLGALEPGESERALEVAEQLAAAMDALRAEIRELEEQGELGSAAQVVLEMRREQLRAVTASIHSRGVAALAALEDHRARWRAATRLGVSMLVAYRELDDPRDLVGVLDAIEAVSVEDRDALQGIAVVGARRAGGDDDAVRAIREYVHASPEDAEAMAARQFELDALRLRTLARSRSVVPVLRAMLAMDAASRSRLYGAPVFAELRARYRDQAQLLDEARGGSLSARMAFWHAFGGPAGSAFDEPLLELAFDFMRPRDKALLALGYWLHRTGAERRTAREQEAHELFQRFWVHYQSKPIGARLRERIVDLLLAAPNVSDLAPSDEPSGDAQDVDGEARRVGRERTARLLSFRVQMLAEREEGVLGEVFTRADESLWLAAALFETHYAQALAAHAGGDDRDPEPTGFISDAELYELSALASEVESRFASYRGDLAQIGQIGAAVASVVASVVVLAVGGPAGVPTATALLMQVAAGAAAGMTATVAARLALEGLHAEGLGQTMARGALEGAIAVAANRLAAGFTSLVGLRGAAARAGVQRLAAEAASSGAGRRIGAEAIEGMVDAFVSGFGENLVFTAFDEHAWRRGVWRRMAQIGWESLAQGAIGLGTGGALSALGQTVRRGARGSLLDQLPESHPVRQRIEALRARRAAHEAEMASMSPEARAELEARLDRELADELRALAAEHPEVRAALGEEVDLGSTAQQPSGDAIRRLGLHVQGRHQSILVVLGEVWLCNDCGSLQARLEMLLAIIAETHPARPHLREALEAVRAKNAELDARAIERPRGRQLAPEDAVIDEGFARGMEWRLREALEPYEDVSALWAADPSDLPRIAHELGTSTLGPGELGRLVRQHLRDRPGGYSGLSEEEFVARYAEGQVLEWTPAGHRWRSLESGAEVAVHRFTATDTDADVLAKLRERGAFQAYERMLRDLGIVVEGDDAILTALAEARPGRRAGLGGAADDGAGAWHDVAEDVARHRFKEQYRDRVLARLTGEADDPAVLAAELRRDYPHLDWAGAPNEARRAALLRRFLTYTSALGSSDRGNLFEVFNRRVLLDDGSERVIHPWISREELLRLGIQTDAPAGRRPDRFEVVNATTDPPRVILEEDKNYTGALSPTVRQQMLESVQLAQERVHGSFALTSGTYDAVFVERVRFTFPQPEGVLVPANRHFLLREVLSNRHVELVVYDWHGRRWVLPRDHDPRTFFEQLAESRSARIQE